jgi:hypothetical protein
MKFREKINLGRLRVGGIYTATYDRPLTKWGAPPFYGTYQVCILKLDQGHEYGIVARVVGGGPNNGTQLSFKPENFKS